jgi:predicted DCC family thiol-disulfide oxidoreductase YuxK
VEYETTSVAVPKSQETSGSVAPVCATIWTRWLVRRVERRTVKIFVVISEQDGETKKEAGTTTTDIRRTTRYFAAHTIERVWSALEPVRRTSQETIVEIREAAPAITILTD